MKKKITMLFAALLAVVGVSAQTFVTPVSGSYYKIKGLNSTHPWLTATVENGGIDVSNNEADAAIYQKTENGLKAVATGKYIGTSGSQISLVDTEDAVILEEANDGRMYISTGGRYLHNNQTDYTREGSKNATPQNEWGFIEVEINNDVTLVYKYMYNGEVWGTEEVTAFTGEAYPAPAARYGVTYTLPEGNVPASAADNTEVEVTCSLAEGFPFVFAKTYNAETAEWYSLTLRAKKVAYVNNSFVYSNDVTTGSFFTFTGNPITGYTIYNYDGGNKAVWGGNTPANGTAIGLVETANGTWELLGTNTADNYLFKVKGTSNSYMHDYNTKFSYWVSNSAATDPGSYVTITSPSAGLQALVEKAGLLTSSANNGVGTITTASATALNTAVDAAKEANTLAEIVNATSSLQEAYQGALNGIVLPKEGKYYTLVSSCTDDHRANQSVYVNREGRMQFAKAGEVASDFARVFQFVPTTTKGKFYIYNVENNTYMNTVGYALALGADAAKPVTITNLGKDNIVKIVPDGQNMMHTQDVGSVIVGWNNDSYTNGSAWTIVETEAPNLADVVKHTLTVTNAGWSTLVLPHNTTIPANVEVFVASEIKDDKVMLSAVEDVLPAHTPVIIKATANDYVFNYTAEEGSVESNLLEGSVFNLNVSEDAYVLANGEMGVGLYKAKFNVVDLNNEVDADGDGDATNDYTAFLNNANKAYLPASAVTSGAQALRFTRGGDDETTSIDNAELTIDNVVIYDLAGRRVEKMEKGIYIVNGKKVIR